VFNLQGSEIIVILLLALVVLGPEKLPDAVRKFTKSYSELKKMSSGFQSELKSALDEPMREMRETANLVRDSADPRKIMAESNAEQRVLDDAPGAPSAPSQDWAAPTPGTAEPAPPDRADEA
jgi:sec-independent protein translocase protein TatB